MGRELETRQEVARMFSGARTVAAGALFCLLVLFAGPVQAQDAAPAPPLVDETWLAQNAKRADVVLLDLRPKDAYLRGHLAGAVFADYPERWRPVGKSGRRGLMRREAFAALAGEKGIGSDSHVILIHGGRNAVDAATAADLYLSFRIQGHPRVSILNAPLRAAADAGVGVEQGEPPPRPAQTFAATATTGFLAGGMKAVREAIGQKPLIDMRRDAEFIGLDKAADVAEPGTVPTARNLPNRWVFDETTGRFRDPETLRRVFALARVPLNERVIFFGNNTALGALGWFVARELLGNQEARVYAAGMGEWMAGDPAENPRIVRLTQASPEVAPVKRR